MCNRMYRMHTMKMGTYVLVSFPVQDSEVLGEAHIQLIAVAAVSSTHIADITHTVPSASRPLPHSSRGHVTSHQLPQTARRGGVMEIIDEADELLAGCWGIVPSPLPVEVLF